MSASMPPAHIEAVKRALDPIFVGATDDTLHGAQAALTAALALGYRLEAPNPWKVPTLATPLRQWSEHEVTLVGYILAYAHERGWTKEEAGVMATAWLDWPEGRERRERLIIMDPRDD